MHVSVHQNKKTAASAPGMYSTFTHFMAKRMRIYIRFNSNEHIKNDVKSARNANS